MDCRLYTTVVTKVFDTLHLPIVRRPSTPNRTWFRISVIDSAARLFGWYTRLFKEIVVYQFRIEVHIRGVTVGFCGFHPPLQGNSGIKSQIYHERFLKHLFKFSIYNHCTSWLYITHVIEKCNYIIRSTIENLGCSLILLWFWCCYTVFTEAYWDKSFKTKSTSCLIHNYSLLIITFPLSFDSLY